MSKLSVNINKIATMRNARGGNMPNVVQVAIDCERFGADGITIHPRPDERHITTKDVYDLSQVVTTEFNIEGYPDERFLRIINEIKPAQATLVPDPPHVLTSNAGWDTKKNIDELTDLNQQFRSMGVRSSIFVDTDLGFCCWGSMVPGDGSAWNKSSSLSASSTANQLCQGLGVLMFGVDGCYVIGVN